jgi:CDP-diacylglycerol--glycerol-3-phosphate 3-phosphatidyltransferase
MKQATKFTTQKRFIPDILSPNVISVIRLCLIPLFVLFFYLKGDNMRFIAAGIFAVAAFTDFLDGFIARKYNKVTTTGKFLDPIADKVLVATALIVMLTHEKFMWDSDYDDWFPTLMGIFVAVIIARELIVSVFREIAADKKVVLAAGMLGKAKTFVQDIAIVMLLISIGISYDLYYPTAGFVVFLIGFILFCIATLLTVISAIEYIVTNRQVFYK